MDLQLKDKVILVSGGAKGIGAGIVHVLAKEGAIPVIVGHNEKDNLAMIAELKAAGGNAWQVYAELSNPDSAEVVVKAILDKYHRLDGVVNNAGVNDGVGLEKGNYETIYSKVCTRT